MSGASLTQLIQKELESGKLKLPVFNKTALELRRTLRQSGVDIEDIADLIRQDPALAARTLTLANSSFYGGLSKIETISKAVIRLGTERVMQLAMSAAGAMAMQTKQEVLKPFMQSLWERSFVSAQACQWLAQANSNEEDIEAAFLAGLPHDIGELFLLSVLEQLMNQQKITVQLSEELIQEVLEALHTRLGGQLMQAWGLPDMYAEIARQHEKAESEPSNQLLATVRLSDQALKKAGIGQKAQPDLVLAATQEAQFLGLNEIQLAQFEVQLDDAVDAARTMKAA